MKYYFSNYMYRSHAGAISTKGPQRSARAVSSNRQSRAAAWQSTTAATSIVTMQRDALQEDISLLRSLHVASPVSTRFPSIVHSHDCLLGIGEKDRQCIYCVLYCGFSY